MLPSGLKFHCLHSAVVDGEDGSVDLWIVLSDSSLCRVNFPLDELKRRAVVAPESECPPDGAGMLQ